MFRTWLLGSMMTLLVAGCGGDGGGVGNSNNNNPGVCGDGLVDQGEECDDGALNTDLQPDACRTNCRNPHCGDAVQDSGEACDDGDDGTNRSDACPNTCQAPACGDGHILDGVEACDDGNTEDGDLCRSDCLQLLTDCGNGLPDPGEECDAGTTNSDTVPNRCRMSCLLPWCGDGVADGDYQEECDDATAMSDTTPNACRTDCALPICGDGVLDDAAPFNESCDGSQLGGATCESLLFVAGDLACAGTCAFDTSGCTNCGNGDCEGGFGEDEISCPADCVETICDDSTDNDNDGLVDCSDPDCAGQECVGSGAGTCRAGQCCEGCWDGNSGACPSGDTADACGQGGVDCQDCDDNNPGTVDTCAGGTCANN